MPFGQMFSGQMFFGQTSSVQRVAVHRGMPDRIGDDDAANGSFRASPAEIASKGFRFTHDGVHCCSFEIITAAGLGFDVKSQTRGRSR